MSTGYYEPPPVRERPPWPPWPVHAPSGHLSPEAVPSSPEAVPSFPEEIDWEPAPDRPRIERRSPASTLPAFAAVCVFIVWAISQAGYPVSAWAPGGMLIVGLVGVALLTVPGGWRSAPRSVLAAVALMAAYTAWSYLSILWASSPGDAYEGATRTLLFLAVFVLFALWRKTPENGALLLGAWTAGVIGLCGIELGRLVASAAPASMFAGERLVTPTGYPNAAAAQWLMAFWPAVALAGWPKLHVGLRAVAAAGAVALAGLALLSQSRGSLFALPLTALAFFIAVPGRLRNLGVLSLVAAGTAAGAPALLHVGVTVAHQPHAAAHSAISTAVDALAAAAVVVGAALATVVTVAGRRARTVAPERQAQLQRSACVAVGLALVLGSVLALVAVGNPVKRAEHAWSSFKQGYSTNGSASNRFVSGLGSNRYDFYRVAWQGFTSHPLTGTGADNYQSLYLRQGHSDETPRYPHSIELRTLEQTGLVGLLLLGGAMLAALAAAWSAIRNRESSAGSGARRLISAAALMPFAYWLIHGSFDWFWEFAGLGAPAFAALGIAASLAPSRGGRGRRRTPASRRLLAVAALGVTLCAALVVFVTLWASQSAVDSAVKGWGAQPAVAYSQLDQAARLDPFSDQAQVLAGSIAVREGDLARAQHEFQAALKRSGDDEYATLELGAVDSAAGERRDAETLLRRAVALAPHDPIARAALGLVRGGGTVDLRKLNLVLYQAGSRLNR